MNKKRRASIFLRELIIKEQAAQGTREKSLRCLEHVREALGCLGGKMNKLPKEQEKKAFGALNTLEKSAVPSVVKRTSCLRNKRKKPSVP